MMPTRFPHVFRVALALALAAAALPGYAAPAAQFAKPLGRMSAAQPISLALALPLRNQPELDTLLKRLYDPADPQYGHYLTPAEFTARFGPTQEDYDAVIAFAKSRGLTVTATHSNRTLLDVAGPAGAVETAFSLHLLRYGRADGRQFYAPDADPVVPAEISARLSGVVGLDNAAVWGAHRRAILPELAPSLVPNEIGSGPYNGLAPSDIKTAYNLNSVTATGAGQTLGLFELDGYHATDITAYESYFHLTNVALQNVYVDGYNGAAGSGADEVTLDIELQIALAPGTQKVVVYEGPNSGQGVVDTYNRIATDNIAKQVSTSWGLYESGAGSSTINSENTAFRQMAAQGQTIYAAAGDSGAYDDRNNLSVDDPASQPYMCGVGGTTLAVNGDHTFNHESTWNGGSVGNGAGGGGISAVWAKPTFQNGVGVSATMRNVPDIALDADPNTGYAIYFNGGWNIYGGTSCAAPLWAAFTALINQQNAANGRPLLGAANPMIYQIAHSVRYGADFHDVADNSTNLYYPATAGYDDATGWGSFNGANLLADLSPVATGGAGKVRYAPRPGFEYRMIGGKFQGSNDNSTYTDLFTVTAAPAANTWTEAALAVDPRTYRYLRYLAPNGGYGNIAELEFDSLAGGTPVKLIGAGFGTPGSWNNGGSTFSNALDGNLGTYLDAPTGDGDFVGIDQGTTPPVKLTGTAFGLGPAYAPGREFDKAFDGDTTTCYDYAYPSGGYTGIDLGAGGAKTVTQIQFFPRPTREYRMAGGKFQGSNTSSSSGYVDLYTIPVTPSAGWNQVTVSGASAYRYLRYVSPANSYGNVSEIEFDGH